MMAGEAKALADFVARNCEPADKLFGDMLQAFPVAIYATDAEGKLTYFNTAAVRLSGRQPELGTDQWCVTWKLYGPDGAPLPHDQCPMALALKGSEAPSGTEYIAERPDGSRFWFTPHPVILRDAEGRVIGGMNLLLDITDRKEAEMGALDASEQYRAIVETTPECVEIVAPDGTLIFMNQQGLKMIGAASPEALTGKSIYHLIAPEDRDRFREFNQKICSGERGSLEFSVIGLHGVRRRMESHAAPLRYVDGATVNLALTRDVTERKRVEEVLRESEERFRRIFEEGPLGLALIGRDYRFEMVNSALCRMVGYSEAELLRMSFVDITHPDDLSSDLQLAERLFRREIPSYRLQKRYVKRSGEIIWINLTASVVHDQEGRPIHGIAMVEDITEVKRTQEEAFNRNKLESLGFMAGGIAHDFNNLLGGILTEAELLESDLAEGFAPGKAIERIKAVALRGSEIVRELMIFAGQDRVEGVEPVDLSTLVQEMMELLKVSVSKQVVLKLALGMNLPSVAGNAGRIRQVVMNLVINASEAIGGKEGVIRISTSQIAGRPCVSLEVSDTGCGMTGEVRAKIFDPFFTTKFAGRGLGLAVVQRTVRDLGGEVDVLSTAGQGSTFRVILPCTAGRTGDPGGVPCPDAAQTVPRAATILVVEDEEVLREAVARALRKRGFLVLEAGDGSVAMDLCRIHQHEINVILLDVTLPGKSSREALEEALRIRPNLKVILTSAYGKETAAETFKGLPITHFIRKPFLLRHLIDLLQASLSG